MPKRKRMIFDLPDDVQMAIRLLAVKHGITTADVVMRMVGTTMAAELSEARKALRTVTPERRRPEAMPRRRTRSEVLKERENAVAGGCCNRFADQMACDCLSEAIDDRAKCSFCGRAHECQVCHDPNCREPNQQH